MFSWLPQFPSMETLLHHTVLYVYARENPRWKAWGPCWCHGAPSFEAGREEPCWELCTASGARLLLHCSGGIPAHPGQALHRAPCPALSRRAGAVPRHPLCSQAEPHRGKAVLTLSTTHWDEEQQHGTNPGDHSLGLEHVVLCFLSGGLGSICLLQ